MLFVLDSNNNLIFGGGVSYSNIDPINLELSLKKYKKDTSWFRKVQSLVYLEWARCHNCKQTLISVVLIIIFFAQGYSGHGLAITTTVGKMLAETTNQNNNLSLFEKFSAISWFWRN